MQNLEQEVLEKNVNTSNENKEDDDSNIENIVNIIPRSIVDGSKLILRLKKDEKLSYESPTRILFSNKQLKLERSVWWLTDVILSENNSLVVLDSCSPGMKFFPVPMRKFGTLYSREGVGHVITGDIIRSRICSRSIPYRNCNKFEYAPRSISSLRNGNSSEENDDIDIVYLRGDDSILRYTLQPNEQLELGAGTLIAWTSGISFNFKSFCCMKFVTSVVGDSSNISTVWIANSGSKILYQHG
ncbi:AIM24 protein [Cryptosporidium felis]|nr:AIM24 protein [Cryptosporidium felis]